MIRSTRTSSLLALPLAGLAALMACDSGAQDVAPAGAPATAAETREAPAPVGGESWVVTIASGPFAGTHRGSDEMNCMIDEGSWAADFDEERSEGVSALMVQVEGVSATGGTSDEAHLGIMFGAPGEAGWGGISLGGATGGTARATATREGVAAVMRVEGATAAGDRVSAEVRCRSAG
jgi:hypothetical protein